eukprot:scaffold55028_cov57-Phaeocystis_antarctica.AAC.3
MGSPPSHSADLVRVRVKVRVGARARVRARVGVAQGIPASRAVAVSRRVRGRVGRAAPLSRVLLLRLPQGARQVGGETRGQASRGAQEALE